MGLFDWLGQSRRKESQKQLEKAARTLDIDVAIAAHENWKIRLQALLDNPEAEELNPTLIACDDKCDLGRWIHGDAAEHLGDFVAFENLKATHKMFHYNASNVVILTQSNRHAEAKQLLDGEFTRLSNRIKQGLTDLQNLVRNSR